MVVLFCVVVRVVVCVVLSGISLGVSGGVVGNGFFVVSLFSSFLSRGSHTSTVSQEVIGGRLVASGFSRSRGVFGRRVTRCGAVYLGIPSCGEGLKVKEVCDRLMFTFHLGGFLSRYGSPVETMCYFVPASATTFVYKVFYGEGGIGFVVSVVSV